MRAELPTEAVLLAENAGLRARLDAAEEMLRAIRMGAVDAFVVETNEGPKIFTLQGLDAESNRFRGEILGQVSDAVIVIDDDQRVNYLNAAAERQYGVTASDALGLHLSEIYECRWLRPEDAAGAAAALRETGCWRGENVHVKRGGEAIHVESSVSCLYAGIGIRFGLLAVIRDITEEKKAAQAHALLEAQLRESQKMEALGTLAGGVAHDFNNILGTILVNAELARQDARTNWQALVSLEEIAKAGHRARDLVQQILSFSRRQPTARRVMSLASIVEESTRLLRAALPGGMRIECYCGADTPPVFADPAQVQQVLLNLGTNAAQAMSDRPGSIDIRVEGITLDETSAQLDLNLRPGRYARIAVSDTGHGMDAATRRRIFEPFFTTRPPGKGTGLGLSVVHGIMQAHQGVIVVHSEPGRGSRFELYFPCANEVAAALGTTEAAGPASEGSGRHILYLDDDEPQLFASKRMLERWGYRVSAYVEQREALDAVLAGKFRFDLVVTDFNMPGTSGLEIAREIHEARPELPVIMVSGYITDELRTQAATAGVRELIGKPQDLEELRDAVQRLIVL
ncbi:MAG: response regulator, partial [Burkholderiales bacterium]|nr:response regulator [Burkholderiales bacterium]